MTNLLNKFKKTLKEIRLYHARLRMGFKDREKKLEKTNDPIPSKCLARQKEERTDKPGSNKRELF